MSRYSIPLKAGQQCESRQECRNMCCFSGLGKGFEEQDLGYGYCGREKVKYTWWDY